MARVCPVRCLTMLLLRRLSVPCADHSEGVWSVGSEGREPQIARHGANNDCHVKAANPKYFRAFQDLWNCHTGGVSNFDNVKHVLYYMIKTRENNKKHNVPPLSYLQFAWHRNVFKGLELKTAPWGVLCGWFSFSQRARMARVHWPGCSCALVHLAQRQLPLCL